MSHPHEWEDMMTISPMDGDGKFRWSVTDMKCRRCGTHATRGPNGFVGDQNSCDDNIVRKVLES